MHRSLSVLAACLFAAGLGVGCDWLDDDTPRPTRAAESTAAPTPLRPGDTVVAPFTGTTYKEGTLERVDGEQGTVAWTDLPKPTARAIEDMFAVPATTSKPELSPGEIVLARIRPATWYGARVVDVGQRIGVDYGAAHTANVRPHEILKVPAALGARIASILEAKCFERDSKRAGRPHAPNGYRPRVGEHVVAPWGDDYYSGTVMRVDERRATVSWEGKQRQVAVPIDRVLPVPSAKSDLPRPGEYLLVSPEEPGGSWRYARVTNKTTDSMTVVMAHGDSAEVSKGDFIRLRPADAGP